jgi:hypothetical protein
MTEILSLVAQLNNMISYMKIALQMQNRSC